MKRRQLPFYKTVSNQQTASPDALFLVTGEFNKTSMKAKLPTFQQCVTVPTRKDKTIDLFYVNVKGAYKDKLLQPLGLSDHNLVHLQPNNKFATILESLYWKLIIFYQ